MSNVWKNLSSETLVNLIGENEYKNICEILPIIEPNKFDPGQLEKRSTLSKIFQAFSGQDSLIDNEFRRELFGSLAPEQRSSLLSSFNKDDSYDYQKFINNILKINWYKSNDIEKICSALDIPFNLVPDKEIQKPDKVIIDNPQEKIRSPFKQLKDYQFPVVNESIDKLSNPNSRFIIQMPTGSGKTRVAMEILANTLNQYIGQNKHIIWLAHSSELLEQAFECFMDIWTHIGRGPAQILRVWDKGKIPDKLQMSSVIFAGFQKLHSVIKKDENSFSHFKDDVILVIADEAHRVMADTYKNVTKKLQGSSSHTIGLSATPGDTDSARQKNLADFFYNQLVTIKAPSNIGVIKYLRQKKILSEVNYEIIQTNINIKLSKKQKEYLNNFFEIHPDVLKELSLSNLRNIEIVKRIRNEAKAGNKIIFFACSVDHSKKICAFLNLLEVNAVHIDGNTRKTTRENSLKDFKEGNIDVLCNYELLSTGFDAPKVNVVMISRPTHSIVLYSQMIGRGLRGPAIGGSKSCKIIDVRDNIQGYSNDESIFDYFQEYFN